MKSTIFAIVAALSASRVAGQVNAVESAVGYRAAIEHGQPLRVFPRSERPGEAVQVVLEYGV